MKVTEGVRRIIVEWRGKGVPPEETAQSLRIPVDEVKAIILQAHPAPPQPKRPEFLEPRYAPPKPAGISDNRQEKKIVEIKPPPANPPRRERRRGK